MSTVWRDTEAESAPTSYEMGVESPFAERQDADPAYAEDELGAGPGALPLAHESEEQHAVRRAIAAGTRDVDELTRVALATHEGQGPGDSPLPGTGSDVLTAEWETLRDSLVRPLLTGEAPAAGGAELWLPKAERVANAKSGGGSYVDSPWRFVFHTVEAKPSASGFRAMAARHENPPHLWAMPSADLLLQTIPLNRSAYALARPGNLQTNRLHAVQVEVWGFAAEMGDVHPQVLAWLAERLLAPVARLVPINLGSTQPAGGRHCIGKASRCRMTRQEWYAFNGVCGHQNVPDNDHWDPGKLDVAVIAARARATMGSSGAVRREEPGSAHDGPGFAAERDEDAADSWSSETGSEHAMAYRPMAGEGSWTELPEFTPTAPPLSSQAPPASVAPPSPPVSQPVTVTRLCCMLEASSLKGVTTYGGFGVGQPGIVYTGKAGFVDLGHLWQVVEVTAFAYQTIHAAGGASGTTIKVSEGEARLTSAAPAGEWLDLARSIADDDALAHEILTYPMTRTPGGHNSSFSPEDLSSNYLGTVVAARALTAGGSFKSEAEKQLKALLISLDAQSEAETRKAFGLISRRWVDTSLWGGVVRPGYLRRRNFTRTPWKAGHTSDATTPSFVVAPFSLTSTYDFTHRSGFTRAQFASKISAIRTQARADYGADYDKP